MLLAKQSAAAAAAAGCLLLAAAGCLWLLVAACGCLWLLVAAAAAAAGRDRHRIATLWRERIMTACAQCFVEVPC